ERQRRHEREHLDAQRVGLAADAVLRNGHDGDLRERAARCEQQRCTGEHGGRALEGFHHCSAPSTKRGAAASPRAPVAARAAAAPAAASASAARTLTTPAGLTAIKSSSPRTSTSSRRSRGPSGSAATTLSKPFARP